MTAVSPDALPPWLQEAAAVDYQIVIPTRGRWRPACEIGGDRFDSTARDRPFVLVKTLAFLQAQGIPPARVTLWTADDEERSRYLQALSQDTYWADVIVRVGVTGIMRQRNHIVQALPENVYVVSLDDDLSDILWKRPLGSGQDSLVPLPCGWLEPLIFHAHSLMKRHNAFIWGLSASRNPRCMWPDGVSTRNGEINGFVYGFINRPHLTCLLPCVADATEDAERSLRFYAHDKVVLRYRLFAGKTKPFCYKGGIQDLFAGLGLSEKQQSRKEAERLAIEQLNALFPSLTLPPAQKEKQRVVATLEIRFRAGNNPVLPLTTAASLQAICGEEKQLRDEAKRRRDEAEEEVAPRPSVFEQLRQGPLLPSCIEVEDSQEPSTSASRAGSAAVVPECTGASFASVSGDYDAEPTEAEAEEIDGIDENRQLEALARGFNGDAGEADAIAAALAKSMEDFELQKSRPQSLADEMEQLRVAKRLSREVSGLDVDREDSQDMFGEGSPSLEPPAKRRMSPVAQLEEMGFAGPEARQALRDAGDDLENAVIMLASAARICGPVADAD